MIQPEVLEANRDAIDIEAQEISSVDEISAEEQAEALAALAMEEQKGIFDPAEAMNTEGFPEFLARFPDAADFDPNATELLEVRYKAFVNTIPAIEGITKVLNTEPAMTKLGVEFGDEAIESHVATKLEEMAIYYPEKLNAIQETITEYNSLIGEIAQVDASIKEMWDNQEKREMHVDLENLKAKEQALVEAEKVSGFFRRKIIGLEAAFEKWAFGQSVADEKDWLEKNSGGSVEPRALTEAFVEERSSARKGNEARLKVKNEYEIDINPAAIREALEETRDMIAIKESQISTLETLEKTHSLMTARFKEIRNVLIESVGATDALRAAAVEQVENKFDELLHSDPEKALEFFHTASEVSGDNAFGAEFFKDDRESTLLMIEKRIEHVVAQDIRKAVTETPLGSYAFNKMMQTLTKFLSKEKVGSKTGEEAKAFVMDTLNSLAERVVKRDKARGLMLKLAIGRLSAAA